MERNEYDVRAEVVEEVLGKLGDLCMGFQDESQILTKQAIKAAVEGRETDREALYEMANVEGRLASLTQAMLIVNDLRRPRDQRGG